MPNTTPGPWTVESRILPFDGGADRPGSHGSQTHLIWTAATEAKPNSTSVVAHIVIDQDVDNAQADANARLIAAAPELLETLDAVLADPDDSSLWIQLVLDVMAKAQGLGGKQCLSSED